MTTLQKIVSRFYPAKVLFQCEVPDRIESGVAIRYALERALSAKVDLRNADLRNANLRNADLSSANLRNADLSSADLRNANLRNADLRNADLSSVRADFFDVLIRATSEIAGLREALVDGRIDGSTYSGECACLVGTIANVRQADYLALSNGLKPDANRPIESWFMNIRKGATPENNPCSRFALEWLDEFVELLNSATHSVKEGGASRTPRKFSSRPAPSQPNDSRFRGSST